MKERQQDKFMFFSKFQFQIYTLAFEFLIYQNTANTTSFLFNRK